MHDRRRRPAAADTSGDAVIGKETIKRWLAGTPLDAPARVLYDVLYRALVAVPTTQPAAPAPAAPHVTLNALYDAQTVAVMARVLARGSNCIDVGCHRGAILNGMLRFAPDGTHFAFEPLPDLFADLTAKYANVPTVRLHELALSDAPGDTTFQHVVTNPAYSGLKQRRYDRPNEQVVEITVKVARLDDVLPSGFDIRLVKIDVEGAELQVLRGGTGMLRRCLPFVVFEHGLGAADCYDTRPEQVFDLLSDCGLRVSLMKDWLEHGSAKAFTRAAFAEEFDTGRNFYYLAHPA
jgi:FkbM family methyltransferase